MHPLVAARLEPMGEPLKWNHGVAFGLIMAAAYFAFHKF